jgi:hypothetical protein
MSKKKINTVEDILLELPPNLVTLITSFLHKKKKPIKTLEYILSNLPSNLIKYILTFLYKKENIGEINFKRKFFNVGLGSVARRPFAGENEIKILCQNEKIIKSCKVFFSMLGIVENNGKYQFYILKKIQIGDNRIGDRNILKLKVWSFHQHRMVMGYEIIDAGNDFFEALYKVIGSCCRNCKKKCESLYDNILFQNY